VTIGDLIRKGKLLEVHCSCRPEWHPWLQDHYRPSRHTTPDFRRAIRCRAEITDDQIRLLSKWLTGGEVGQKQHEAESFSAIMEG